MAAASNMIHMAFCTQDHHENIMSLLDDSPWEIPVRRDLLSQVGGNIYHPQTRDMKTVGLAPEGNQPLNYGLSTDVVETILNSRALHFIVQRAPVGPT